MKPFVRYVFTVLTALWLVSCGDSTSRVSSGDVERFAKRAGIVIPRAAKAIDFRSPMSMDGLMMLRLEMPMDDLEEFLSKSGLDGLLNNTTRPGAATSYLGEFLPAHPKEFREGQKSLTAGEFLNVLVDEDSSTRIVVYLQWFGT